MKKTAVFALLVSLLVTLFPVQARAQQNGMKEVLETSFYGGLTGALIGGAFLAFRDKPSDHLKDLRVGAAAGVIIGALYGVAKTTKAFAEIDHGKFTFHVPTLQFDLDPGDKSVRGSIYLLQIPFQ